MLVSPVEKAEVGHTPKYPWDTFRVDTAEVVGDHSLGDSKELTSACGKLPQHIGLTLIAYIPVPAWLQELPTNYRVSSHPAGHREEGWAWRGCHYQFG